MATTTGNDSLSEASAIDDMCQAPTTPIARNSNSRFAHVEIIALNREIETFRTQLELAQFADIAREKQRASDNAKRIENLVLATRELEALIIKRDAEIAEKSVSLMHYMNVARDAESRADGLEILNDAAMNRIAAHEADMKGTLERVADLELSLKIMSEVGTTASSDAEKYMDNARELSEMLNDSSKREDRMWETLQGIRALAGSESLTDAEKVALILRLA